MKKFLFSLLVLFIIFSLGACKVDDNDNNDDDDIEDPGEKDPNEEDPGEEDPDEEEPTEEELVHERIMNILDGMTLEDKIGQMFMVGFSGTTVPSSLNQAVKNNRFGNFIYFGENVADDSKVPVMSSTIQDIVMEEIGIPAFISMDQEGGMVVRFAEHATHFIGNMGLVATGNPENAYNVGKYSGLELRHYGVNVNLAPSLDVNNNPNNPIIGIRSFSDKPEVVTSYGLNMIKGYKESNVLATVKHFPGHGDTSVDTHYGLPSINYDKERLYEIELAPFIAAIEAGVDSIMTAHIIFNAYDEEYPATLSHKVITGLLREELGYDGIVMTDEMRMDAIRKNFGVGEAAVLAIQAGVDILLYAESTSTSLEAHAGVLEACLDGTISEERINESVYRILKKKIKYGLLDDYKPSLNLTDEKFAEHKAYTKDLVEKSITLAKGNTDWFSKDKSTLIISTVCTRHPLLPGYVINTNNNSFAYVGKNYLISEGVSTVEHRVIGTSIRSNDINNLVNLARGYDQVIIAVENVSTSQATLINNLSKEDLNLVVVALKNPYDYLSYNQVVNYICTYGYFSDSVFAVFDLLLGKYNATGVLPVKVTGLN